MQGYIGIMENNMVTTIGYRPMQRYGLRKLWILLADFAAVTA